MTRTFLPSIGRVRQLPTTRPSSSSYFSDVLPSLHLRRSNCRSWSSFDGRLFTPILFRTSSHRTWKSPSCLSFSEFPKCVNADAGDLLPHGARIPLCHFYAPSIFLCSSFASPRTVSCVFHKPSIRSSAEHVFRVPCATGHSGAQSFTFR
jgi:hypothetical protein